MSLLFSWVAFAGVVLIDLAAIAGTVYMVYAAVMGRKFWEAR